MSAVNPKKVEPIAARQVGELARLLETRGVGRQEFQILIENPDALVAIVGTRGIQKLEKVSIEKMVESERKVHLAFFGQGFDLTHYQEVLRIYGSDKLTEWKNLGLEVHYLPPVLFDQESDFPGWKVKPEEWYWEQLAAGRLLRCNRSLDELCPITEAGFKGVVVLVDTRKKPAYRDGRQMFVKDRNFLGNIVAGLRKEGKIARYEYGPQTSRFGISVNEWECYVRFALDEMIPEAEWRLEMAIEANVIPQLYLNMPRKDDGQTNTWVWYEEYFGVESSRLRGGNSEGGGLFDVGHNYSAHPWRFLAIRSLGVLSA